MVTDEAQRGPGITRDGDTRITRAGGFLRKLKERRDAPTPQVLKDEISIVGHRLEDPHYVTRYTPRRGRMLTARLCMASPAFIKYDTGRDLWLLVLMIGSAHI